jgi:hypothetical protein
LVGKDHSIVPEFRISELIETYVEDNEGDFLVDIDNVFSLTGAAISDSSHTDFYKTYSNSDFLKYFSVIDEDLNEQRSGILKNVLGFLRSKEIRFLFAVMLFLSFFHIRDSIRQKEH